MLRAAIAFFVLALVAMIFGATGFAGGVHGNRSYASNRVLGSCSHQLRYQLGWRRTRITPSTLVKI